MPAKGTRKIPDEKRVEIVIAKELKPNGSDTNGTLAAHYDVAEITVRKVTYEKLSEEAKVIYRQKMADLKYQAADLASIALIKSKELALKADSAKYLQGVVAAGKFAHDVYRLETGQATSIIQDQAQMLKSLVDYCKLHAKDNQTLAAMVLYAEGSGVSEEMRRVEAERIMSEGSQENI